jgi:hypothetical protein
MEGGVDQAAGRSTWPQSANHESPAVEMGMKDFDKECSISRVFSISFHLAANTAKMRLFS